MAWTAPMTAVANEVFTATQYNTYVRDNLLETMPAKATTAGSWFTTSSTNTIAQRTPSENIVATAQTTTSTSYVDLATSGPAVTVTTGTKALVWVYASLQNTSATSAAFMSYAVSGATTLAASDDRSIAFDTVLASRSIRTGMGLLHTGLTAGSNTFTAKYRVDAGTGSYVDRRITVLPL